jgi:acetoin utilization deacetylase AcuC-like enzyme
VFYDDPNILYISLHVHQDGKFYPGGDEGDWDHCGAGAGLGKYAYPEICRSELCALISI